MTEPIGKRWISDLARQICELVNEDLNSPMAEPSPRGCAGIDGLEDEIGKLIAIASAAELYRRPCSVALTRHTVNIPSLDMFSIEFAPTDTFTAKIDHDNGMSYEITGTVAITLTDSQL